MEKFSNVVPATTLNTLKYSGVMAKADFICNGLQENLISYDWVSEKLSYSFKVGASITDNVYLNEVCKNALYHVQNYFLNPSDVTLHKVHAALRA